MNLKYKYLFPLLATLLMAAPVVSADEASLLSWFSIERKKGVKPVDNELYREECGSCHFAYQPGLLPARSWQQLLSLKALEDHFGENAELDPETQKSLLNYLVKYSAEKSSYKRSKKIALSSSDSTTLIRITENDYIRNKHSKIPKEIIKSEKVKSLSYCDACHTQAEKGSFDDDQVSIPGYADWDN